MQCEVGELVLQGSNQGAHLGWRSVSGGDLMLRYNNVAGPGPQGGDQSFWAWECECACGEQVTVLAFFPGRARREQGGHLLLGPGPVFGCHCCLGGQPQLEPGGRPHPHWDCLRQSLRHQSPLEEECVGWLEKVHWKESLVVEPLRVCVVCLLRIIFSMLQSVGSGAFRTLSLLVREDSCHLFFHKEIHPPRTLTPFQRKV